MRNLQKNLSDLWHRYVMRPETADARRRIAAARENSLEKLLRHHDIQEIAHDETVLRDEFDRLLGGYSLLEVAAVAGVIPEQLPPDIAVQSASMLKVPAVYRYYTDNYPLTLPQAFLSRLDGFPRFSTETSAQNTLAFDRFLNLYDRVWGDDDVETILWFLDDGSCGDDDLESVIAVLASEDELLDILGHDDSARPRDSAIFGLQKFLKFGVEFEELLSDVHSDELRYAMWLVFEYWFTKAKSKLQNSIARLNAVIENREDALMLIDQDGPMIRAGQKLASGNESDGPPQGGEAVAVDPRSAFVTLESENSELIEWPEDAEQIFQELKEERIYLFGTFDRLSDESRWNFPPPQGSSSQGGGMAAL